MEAEELQVPKMVHHGHNVKRARKEKNMKQETLSSLVNLTQSAVSKYESMKMIEDKVLEKFAKALDIPVEDLKTLEEEAPMMVFENNTNNIETVNGGNIGPSGYEYSTINNPLDKINDLFERLLKEKDERIAMLEKQLADSKQK